MNQGRREAAFLAVMKHGGQSIDLFSMANMIADAVEAAMDYEEPKGEEDSDG